MQANGHWVYWKEQCEYCVNQQNCTYNLKDYMDKLENVKPDSPVYGRLEFICDYFVFSEELYHNSNLSECHCCG